MSIFSSRNNFIQLVTLIINYKLVIISFIISSYFLLYLSGKFWDLHANLIIKFDIK